MGAVPRLGREPWVLAPRSPPPRGAVSGSLALQQPQREGLAPGSGQPPCPSFPSCLRDLLITALLSGAGGLDPASSPSPGPRLSAEAGDWQGGRALAGWAPASSAPCPSQPLGAAPRLGRPLPPTSLWGPVDIPSLSRLDALLWALLSPQHWVPCTLREVWAMHTMWVSTPQGQCPLADFGPTSAATIGLAHAC